MNLWIYFLFGMIGGHLLRADIGSGGISLDDMGRMGQLAPSARLASPASKASFDAGNYQLPHVQNEPSDDQSATCGKPEPNTAKQSTSQSREVVAFNPSIFTVDVIKVSKNRWKIRIRCRKQNCEHSDHLKIKTVSLISDSVYRKLIRSKRKYELWKKAILAENARTLRKSN